MSVDPIFTAAERSAAAQAIGESFRAPADPGVGARASTALSDSERRLNLVLEAGRIGCWQLDLVTGTLDACAQCRAHYGLGPDGDLTYPRLLSMVHPADRARRQRALRNALANGDYCCEYRARWPDGSVHWLSARGQVVHDDTGQPLRVIGVLFEIDERAQREKELRRLNAGLEKSMRLRMRQLESEVEERARAQAAERASEARYAAVFEHTTAGIILLHVDADGQFIYEAVNPTHERFTGMAAAEFVGLTSYDLFPRELADRLVGHYRRAVETGAPCSYEETFPYRAGTRVLQATVVPIRDSGGVIAKLLISTHDMTARKRAEETRRQGQKMAAVGQLTGGVAHDFNNLLTAVIGNLELLSQRVREPAHAVLIDAAMRAADRGARLTQQLLAFARRQRLEAKPVDLNHLVLGMRDMLLSTIGATIRIETALARGLWPAMVDVNQTELMLLNLAINARDAMPAGGTLTIGSAMLSFGPDQRRPAELAPGDYLVLSVADTGTGMCEEVRERAFEPFFTTKEVGMGSGLGLSQVYGIARQLGGGVEIDSQPGAGCTVRVYLPRADAAAAAEAAPEAAAPVPPGSARILVVDDDPEVRELVVACLASFGYAAIDAPDARRALDLIAEAPPDLVLVDFAMPEMDGAELIRRARHARPQLKAMFMTGYAQAAPFDGEIDGISVLRKPFKLRELAAKLDAALR
ncbi:MAG TPA: PAS domain-containing protein [Stellaceae bacterium]|nr:PAS domain-containing protein [Stellaceae bacterium]